ncbi:MAG TPA: hypothetical protein PKE51_01815, partial [Gemmatimonadaceae bacterium]|nr:hypothetical protein [Gemmatimonadaceae bacterium]
MANSAGYGAWLLLGLLAGQSVLAPPALTQEARRLPLQEVPLRPFASEARAHLWLMRQAENGIEAIRRAARARGCTPAADPSPYELRCRSHTLNSVVLREFSRRQLVLVDSAMAPVRSGSGVQLAGDALYVMREGELVRVELSGDRAVAGDVQQTRLAPAEWMDDSDDEVITWGNLIVTLNRGQRRHPVLRTYVANASGRLEPRDTLVVTGDAPHPLHHVASRVRGHELLLYATWPVLNDFDESVALSAIAPALPDGEPVVVRPPVWFRRVYRPVSGVDTTDALNHVHALLRCDLRAAPLACNADLVMAGAARRHAFTERALEIETEVQRGALHVRLPYAGSPPRAFVGPTDSSSRVVRHAGPYRITTTRTNAPERNDTSASIVDTVTIVRPGTSRVWRVTLPHHVERAVALGSRLLLVGPARGEVRATLVRLGRRAEVLDVLRLPDAGGARDGAVLTAHQVEAVPGDHFRVGYTVVDYAVDTRTNPGGDYDAAWFLEVRADSLASLGLLRATAGTFSDEADVDTYRMPLGASQAMLRGDRVYAIFHKE